VSKNDIPKQIAHRRMRLTDQVLTHDVSQPPDDPGIVFLSGNVDEAVAKALAAAAGKNVVLIGADIAGQCIDAGLVDEMLIHLVPILLGAGIRLFDRPGSGPIKLEPTHVTTSGQVTNLRFRVRT